MDQINSLTLFVRAAQNRSFSVAARQLGISPSALSKSVQRLEERLGTRLFNRTTRRITLTEDGAEFYERCRQILDEIAEAELALSKARSTPTGTLRISLAMAIARLHIVPALTSFTERYPDLKLDISLSDGMVDLIESGIDAVVRVGEGPDSRLIMRRLAMARYVICAAPSYLARYGEPQTPEELESHNCINFVSPRTGRAFEWFFQRDGEEFSLPIEGRLRFDHAEAQLAAAIGGAGIIQVHNYIAGAAIANGELKPVLKHFAPTTGSPIAVVYPQKRHLSAKVLAFVDFMSELMAQLRQQQIVE